MANPYRGEVALKLDGESRTLRLSLASLARLEQTLATPDLSALIKLLVGGQVSAAQIACVLCEALRTGEGHCTKEAEILLGHAAPLSLARCYVDLMRATFADREPG